MMFLFRVCGRRLSLLMTCINTRILFQDGLTVHTVLQCNCKTLTLGMPGLQRDSLAFNMTLCLPHIMCIAAMFVIAHLPLKPFVG